jgi:hypothetical protein
MFINEIIIYSFFFNKYVVNAWIDLKNLIGNVISYCSFITIKFHKR